MYKKTGNICYGLVLALFEESHDNNRQAASMVMDDVALLSLVTMMLSQVNERKKNLVFQLSKCLDVKTDFPFLVVARQVFREMLSQPDNITYKKPQKQ